MDLLRQVRRGRLTRALVPLLALVAFPTGATAATTSSTTNVSYTANNPCTGEAVMFEGKMHQTVGTNVNLNGTITISHTLDMTQATGATVTGVKYTTTESDTQHMVIDFDVAPLVTTAYHRLRYTRQGESAMSGNDDFLMYARVHVTINANGDATAAPADFDIVCS